MLVCADGRRMPLGDGTVQCVVTSPPYWGLRKYAGAQEVVWLDGWRGAYSLEPTVEMYVAHTVEVLREVRRVLRDDGVCFWNVGDSYAASNRGSGGHSAKQDSNRGSWTPGNHRNELSDGLKPKDLCLIPQRVMLAAQGDGWWVRSVIIWAKPNPMPESVTDRPSNAYEQILMLTKAARYFWDAQAVKEAHSSIGRVLGGNHRSLKIATHKRLPDGAAPFHSDRTGSDGVGFPAGGRNLRNVWTFPKQPYSGAHFATFPEELPRRCILAATSAKGACRACGAPWARVVRKLSESPHDGQTASGYEKDSNAKRIALLRQAARERGGEYVNETRTLGWRPTCECRGQHGKTAPCVVLDPFGGSGTTGRVAIELNRQAVLLDLAYADGHKAGPYAELATKRATGVQRRLGM